MIQLHIEEKNASDVLSGLTPVQQALIRNNCRILNERDVKWFKRLDKVKEVMRYCAPGYIMVAVLLVIAGAVAKASLYLLAQFKANTPGHEAALVLMGFGCIIAFIAVCALVGFSWGAFQTCGWNRAQAEICLYKLPLEGQKLVARLLKSIPSDAVFIEYCVADPFVLVKDYADSDTPVYYVAHYF